MISEKQYYSEKRVSSSSLKWFESSPKFFRKQLTEEIKQIKLSFLELGKQIHMALLEPDLFKKSYIHLEYETPKSENQKVFCETYVKHKEANKKSTTKECSITAYSAAYNISGKSEIKIEEEATKLYKSLRKYIDYLIKSKEYKDVLSNSTWSLINELKEAVSSHKKASQLLLSPDNVFDEVEEYNEYVIFWEYHKGEDKVLCKSMLDRFVIDKTNKIIKLIDIKTTSDIGDFSTSLAKYKYYRQMSFYWMALYSKLRNEINFDEYAKETYIVAVQTKTLPECKVFTIDETLLNKGLEEIQKLMADISWHYKNDLWEHSREYYDGDGSERIEII